MGTYHITAADGGVYEVEAASDQAAAELETFINARIKAGDTQLMGAAPPGNTQVIRPEATKQRTIAPPRNAIQDSAAKPDIKSVIMQGLTAGLSDEAVGAGGMLANALIAPFSKKVDFDPSGAYRRTRDAERARVEATRKQSPWLSFGGELAGSLLTGGTAAANAGKGLSSLIRQGAKVGAGAGAISGFGYGEGAENSLVGAGLGAGLGAAIGGVLPVASRLAGKTISGARQFASPQGGVGRNIVAKALEADNVSPRAAGLAIQEAEQRGVPLMLADLGSNIRGLAGSLSRRPGQSRTIARNAVLGRQEAQGERIRGAITRDLGPIVNPDKVSEQLIARAKANAGPLYDEAYAAPGVEDLQIADLIKRPSMQRALGNARSLAMEEGRDPFKLGFVMNDGGDVTIPNFDRFVEARGPKPASPMSVISGQGNSAPADLVTFVRRNGGMRDTGRFGSKGGEMRSMGFSNAGRKGVPMAGQDAKFGPLVNETGLTYDEMAERAWEAGYFGPPSTTPRPSEREFLDALDDNYRGGNRTFSIHDEATANDYANLERNMHDWEAAEGIMADRSIPAGPREFAPPTAFGNTEEIAPTWQTLDYIKRGLDDVVQANKTAGAGRLDTAGRATNNTLQELLQRVDEANPAYAAARAAYAGPTRERQALELGTKALNASDQEILQMTGNLSDSELDQFLLGYRAAMGQAVDRRVDGGNKAAALLGTPRKRQALEQAFGDRANLERFGRTLQDENQAYETYRAIATGSPTAERLADDAMTDDLSLLQDATGKAIKGAATGGIAGLLASGMDAAGDVWKFGAGKAGERAREDAAALLFNTDRAALEDAMRQAFKLQAADRLRLQSLDRGSRYVGGLFGRGAGGVAAIGSRPPE